MKTKKISAMAVAWRQFYENFKKKLGFGPRTEKQRTGARGERLASDWLHRNKGFQLLLKNVRIGGGEIDLIGWCGQELVFVEVRSRSESAMVQGRRSITRQKMAVLRKACRAYLRSVQPPPKHYRFDVVEIQWRDNAEPKVNHYENVALFRRKG